MFEKKQNGKRKKLRHGVLGEVINLVGNEVGVSFKKKDIKCIFDIS